MGSGSSTDCCTFRPPGPCPRQPAIQCTDTFLNQCDGVNSICTTFIQTDVSNSTLGTCSATQPCCQPKASGGIPAISAAAWLYDDPNNPCPAQASCVTVQSEKCNVFGIGTGSVIADVCAGENGGNISINRSTSIPVTCKWDAGLFRSLDNVKKWLSSGTFDLSDATTRKKYNTEIMPTLCSTPQTDACPTANSQGEWVGNVCSPYVATNETGSFCRSWLSGLSNDTKTVEAVNSKSIVGYCEFLANEAQNNPSAGLKNGEVNECLCINAGNDTSGPFVQTRDALASNGVNNLGERGCWYVPCNSDTTQLLPLSGNATQPIYYPTGCPNVCKAIFDIGGNINNSRLTANINCPGTAPNPPNEDGSGNNNNGGGNNNNNGGGNNGDPTNQESFWEKYRWLIIGGAALILILIIFFVIFVVLEEEKKKDK